MIKQTIHAISLCLLLFFTSCTKSTEEKQWQAEISENKAASLKDIFLQNGSEKLIAIIASKDEVKMSNLNKTKSNQIASYFQDKFKIGITKEFIDNPEGIVILGLFYAKKEQQVTDSHIMSNSTNNVMKTSDENMDCFLTAVGDFIGISQAKSIWRGIVMGASEQTVIAAVKLIGRRVAGIISVALMVYATGSCLDWW
jgi:hypothetical protein